MVAYDSGGVKVWDAQTGQELLALKGHTDSIRSIAFSPDGKTLASGSTDKAIILWDLTASPPTSQTLTGWFALWDLLIAGSAWIGAYYLRFDSGLFPVTKEIPDEQLCWNNLPLVLLLALIVSLVGMGLGFVVYYLVGEIRGVWERW